MNWSEFANAVRDGGWVVLLVYFLYKELWPLISKQFIPAQMKAVEEQRAELVREKKEDREAKLQQQREENEFRHEIERERLKSAQATSLAIQQLSTAMVTTNERMLTILENQKRIQEQQLDTQQFLSDSIAAMREARAHAAGVKEGKNMPKTGPLQSDKDHDKPE